MKNSILFHSKIMKEFTYLWVFFKISVRTTSVNLLVFAGVATLKI